MTKILSLVWIIEFLYIHVESDILLSAIFVILCFSRNTTFFVCFLTFLLFMLQNDYIFIKSYVFCLNKRKPYLIYRKFIVLTLPNKKIDQVAMVPLASIVAIFKFNLKMSLGPVLNDIIRSSQREAICLVTLQV